MEPTRLIETGAAALLFAAVFLWGGHVEPLRALGVQRRSLVSFSAGMASAYVFVHVMPELHSARSAFAESASVTLPYEGMAIYFVALVGFLTFYGLDHLRAHLGEPAAEGGGSRAFRLHVVGFSAYVALVGYLLVRNLEDTPTSTALFAAAFAVHFLAIDHTLRKEHGAEQDRVGRIVLACAVVAGWSLGQLLALPPAVLAPLLAFVSGAVIMNSAIGELPAEKDGRFVPFLLGGLGYGLILLPLG